MVINYQTHLLMISEWTFVFKSSPAIYLLPAPRQRSSVVTPLGSPADVVFGKWIPTPSTCHWKKFTWTTKPYERKRVYLNCIFRCIKLCYNIFTKLLNLPKSVLGLLQKQMVRTRCILLNQSFGSRISIIMSRTFIK